MYTYERLNKLCNSTSNDSHIAHYLLKNMNGLSHIKINDIVKNVGISKASLQRFYSKGGYQSFNDLITTLNDEVESKKKQPISFNQYQKDIEEYCKNLHFNDDQLAVFLNQIKKTKHIAFYGNSYEISYLKKFTYTLFLKGIDVIFLDCWNMNDAYNMLEYLDNDDIFVVVETSWRIQGLYERSINISHMLNLDAISTFPFHKFYIGRSNIEEYAHYYNIDIPYEHHYLSFYALSYLDEQLSQLLEEL